MCKEHYTWIRAVIYTDATYQGHTDARLKAPYLKDKLSDEHAGQLHRQLQTLFSGRRRWVVMIFLRLRFT